MELDEDANEAKALGFDDLWTVDGFVLSRELVTHIALDGEDDLQGVLVVAQIGHFSRVKCDHGESATRFESGAHIA